MHITYDEKLIAYMKKKGYAAIIVETVGAVGCCADVTELSTRFIRENDVPKIKETGCGVHEGDWGEVLVLTKGLHYDSEISFKLRSFFGAKDIVIKGIAPWKI